MYLSKNSSTRTPSHLSTVTIAVISINAALISVNTFAENSTQLETLVVTGEKIDKNIKETTTAVTIIHGEDLTSGETKGVKELATQAPNVVISSFGNVAIRGMSGNGAASGGYALITGARSRVSTVIDGGTQDWSGYNFTPSGVWDAKQVEVLRGPQSTTQGTSSIAGALVIKTNDPTFTDESSIRAGLESYENGNLKYNLGVMSSGALIDDELAYRIALDGTKGEGWMNYAQTSNELDTGPDVDDAENYNMRGKLLWEPAGNPNLTAKLTVEHHKYEGEYLSWANDEGDNFSGSLMTLGSGNNIRLQDSKTDSVAVDIDYNLGNGINNVLYVAYNKSKVSFDEYPGITLLDITKDTTTIENRIIFNQPNKALMGVIGLFASKKDADTDITYRGRDWFTANDTSTTTLALYGEGSYALTEKTNLIGGARLEREEADRLIVNDGRTDVDHDDSETNFLPKIGITHAISNTTTLGANVRKGYSPGGSAYQWDSTREFYIYDSEEIIAYEVSSKSQFENGTTLNTALFYNDYSNYQAMYNDRINNIDSAHTYGLEVEAATWATDDLQLRGSIGLLRSEINNDETSKGNELPSAPEINLSLGFTQYIGEYWSFGADTTYVGEYYSDLDNTEDYKAGDYVRADARIQYVNGSLTIDGYVKNLTDENIIYQINGGSSVRASVGQTRTMGLSATYHM
ncbi:TonB-dependent receptor [Oceanospirillum linum]|uniref:TonB-dependent receptor n=1 Tax=Oceanospirillum linum TaxID=966 RepID=A0A1T1HDV7_OCELI|nr:TonB-dependent receptor [Oceanospirillum linum]OOV87992.1 TonB-dependent receptor [Oceanospirillum linum]SEF39772.1 Outer membrane receptor for ferrienterochelin and colicins [Oleiphilus messinensis]SMP00364.1 Outer membrane receptor for ferrienterochelin and colicins [Oceanospirillum linum]